MAETAVTMTTIDAAQLLLAAFNAGAAFKRNAHAALPVSELTCTRRDHVVWSPLSHGLIPVITWSGPRYHVV